MYITMRIENTEFTALGMSIKPVSLWLSEIESILMPYCPFCLISERLKSSFAMQVLKTDLRLRQFDSDITEFLPL